MLPFAVLKSDPVADFERYIEEYRQRFEGRGDVVILYPSLRVGKRGGRKKREKESRRLVAWESK
jgi:hypothetical protein